MPLFYLCIIPFLAVAYRARGGAISFGAGKTTLARFIFWALPVGAICTLLSYSWCFPLWIGAICAVMAFAGACIGHSTEQSNNTEANIEMGGVTNIMLFLIMFPLAIAHHGSWYSLSNPIILSILGFLGAPAYIIGWRIPFSIPFLCQAKSTEWGEVLTGGFAFGLPLAILGLLS